MVSPVEANVVFLTPHETDAEAMARLLEPTLLRVHHATTLVQAGELLLATKSRVLMAETIFSDGNWKDVVAWLGARHPKVALVVIDAHADARLWSETIHRGAYDLIPKPFYGPEVCRILCGAERHAVSGDLRFMGMAS